MINHDNVHKLTVLLKLPALHISEQTLKTKCTHCSTHTEMLKYKRKWFRVIRDTIINNGR